MTKVINLFAGPGAGKSTLAAGLFYKLKINGYNAELALEYAKDLTWEERHSTLKNQFYVIGKQFHRITRLLNKVDFIITDSPILLGLFYGAEEPPSFKQYVLDCFNSLDNQNFFINRFKKYNPLGRNQTEEEAEIIDSAVLNLLMTNEQPFLHIAGTKNGLEDLYRYVTDT